MEVVVTGGCGFIGSNLVERLVAECSSAIVFDNLTTRKMKNIKGLPVKFPNEPYIQLRSLGLNEGINGIRQLLKEV